MSDSHYSLSEPMNQLLLELGRAPVADAPWQDFLSLLAAAMDADSCTLILRQPRQGDTGVVFNSVLRTASLDQAYRESYYALDPFVDLPAGQVCSIDEFIEPDEYYQSDYYQRFLKGTGVGQLLGADLWDDLGNFAGLRMARLREKSSFSVEQRALCQTLLPHLQQTVRLHARIERLNSERALFADTVDQMAMGAIILDQQGQIRRSNREADAWLREGSVLANESGRLRVGDVEQNREFRRVLDEVMQAHLAAEPSVARVFRLEGEPGLGVLLRPLPQVAASAGTRSPSVAIFISDPGRTREADAEVLCQLFGFTRAESRLALQLANGATLDEAAENLHVSRNTAKSHLSALFSKTGVARQSRLIQLILQSVAPLASPQ